MKINKGDEHPDDEGKDVSYETDSDFDETQFSIPLGASPVNKNYLIVGSVIFSVMIGFVLYFFVFGNNMETDTKVTSNSTDYDALKRKELELKERELELREKQLNQSQLSGSVENYELDNVKEDISNTVNNLLTAWQNKDIKGFFVNLTNDYRYESIDGIKRNYDERYNKAYEIFANNSYIKISVSDMTIDVNGNYAEVRYRQKYSSSTLNDTTIKKLYLRKENNRWKVYKELSGFS